MSLPVRAGCLVAVETIDQVERWLTGPIEPGHGQLLEDLVLFSTAALWPDARMTLLLQTSLLLPRPFVAWAGRRTVAELEGLFRRAARRILALGLTGRIRHGAGWCDQLFRIRGLVGFILHRATQGDESDHLARVELARIGLALATFLTNHPICGTPESHQVRRQAEMVLAQLRSKAAPRHRRTRPAIVR